MFVAGDLLWSPVEDRPDIRRAPDAMVAVGRPKGDRGSYRQWEEDGVAQIPFYTEYGVEEYYVCDPDSGALNRWQRHGEFLGEIARMERRVSPGLGVRFEIEPGELMLYRSDSGRFATYLELSGQRDHARQRANQERERAARLAVQLRVLGIEPQEE